MIMSLVGHPAVGYGSTILSGCSVLGPKGPEVDWFAAEKGFAPDESPPIFGHNTLPAIAQTLQSPASAGWGLGQRTRTAPPGTTYFGGDDIELEFFPVIVGLFECLHLSPSQTIPPGRPCQRKECHTSVSVHVRMRSRSRLKRICNAGT